MNPTQPLSFAGTFKNINTYSRAFDVPSRPGAIASEDLSEIAYQAMKNYHVDMDVDPLRNPATLRTGGPAANVSEADAFIRGELTRKGAKYDYSA